MQVSINPAVVYAELEDGAVLLNTDSGLYYGLDEVGSRIWTLIAEGACEGAIVRQLQTEYVAEAERLRADVATFVHLLEARGLVRGRAS
jgi:Coenzyme PQQ synthesis protein D (PqqD)